MKLVIKITLFIILLYKIKEMEEYRQDIQEMVFYS